MISETKFRRFYGNKVSPNLAREVFSAGRRDKTQVILEFPTYYRYYRFLKSGIASKMGVKLLYELPIINSLAVEAPTDALMELIPLARVRMAWLDAKVHPCLDVAVPAIHADIAHRKGITGEGVTVAVLDTGIAPHPDLVSPKSRIIGWLDLVNNKPEPYDDEGHGTHVAGIIAGNGRESGGKYVGVAPGADLVGIKVLDKEGSGPTSRVIAGVQWAVENKEKYKIKILNLSLGGPAEEGYRTDPMSKAVEAAWRNGLTVCVAAGNTGPDRETITSPGIAPSIITVGSVDDKNTPPRRDDAMSDFSSRGPTVDRLPKPDIVAPGGNIISLKPGGGYVSLSGTSMATPMISGSVALLLAKDPNLTPDRLKRILLSTAEDRGYGPLIQGAGYLDLSKALQLPEEETSETDNDLILVFLLLLGLSFVKGEAREELQSVLQNSLVRWLKKMNLKHLIPILRPDPARENPAMYDTVFNVIRALGQWLTEGGGLGI